MHHGYTSTARGTPGPIPLSTGTHVPNPAPASYPGGHVQIALWLFTEQLAGLEHGFLGTTQGLIQSSFRHASKDEQSLLSVHPITGSGSTKVKKKLSFLHCIHIFNIMLRKRDIKVAFI